MDLKGLIADQMGHFTPYDIIGALLCVLLAALFAFLLGLLSGSGEGTTPRNLSVLAAVVAMAVVLVRASVPLAIALVGIALLVRLDRGAQPEPGPRSWRSYMLLVASTIVGVGCGSGAALPVLALLVPLVILFRWAVPAKRS